MKVNINGLRKLFKCWIDPWECRIAAHQLSPEGSFCFVNSVKISKSAELVGESATLMKTGIL